MWHLRGDIRVTYGGNVCLNFDEAYLALASMILPGRRRVVLALEKEVSLPTCGHPTTTPVSPLKLHTIITSLHVHTGGCRGCLSSMAPNRQQCSPTTHSYRTVDIVLLL